MKKEIDIIKKDLDNQIIKAAVKSLEQTALTLLDLVKITNAKREELANKLLEYEAITLRILWREKEDKAYKLIQEERWEGFNRINEAYKIISAVYTYFEKKHRKASKNK